MPTIHIPGDGHLEPSPLADGTQWTPWADPNNRKVLDAALFILQNNVRGMKQCNDCFKKLPNGRSFDDILADPAVFISFDPSGPNFAVTVGNDLTISIQSNNSNRWSVAATIVHEFAHIDGVPGGGHGVAEGMLRCCGLAGLVQSGTDIAGPDEDAPAQL
jgi:hypothetical protein